jgi:hypothetical protein
MPDEEPRLTVRQEDLIWHTVKGDLVTLDLPSGECFAINATGALLWARLTAGTTRSELIQLLCERYGIAAERAGGEVDDFLSGLAARRLLA